MERNIQWRSIKVEKVYILTPLTSRRLIRTWRFDIPDPLQSFSMQLKPWASTMLGLYLLLFGIAVTGAVTGIELEHKTGKVTPWSLLNQYFIEWRQNMYLCGYYLVYTLWFIYSYWVVVTPGTRGLFLYKISLDIVSYDYLRLNLLNLSSKLLQRHRFESYQTLWHYCCRKACKISERSDYPK